MQSVFGKTVWRHSSVGSEHLPYKQRVRGSNPCASTEKASTKVGAFCIMAYVYILYSTSVDKYYVGGCNALEERLSAHRQGTYESSFTATRGNDWELYLSIKDLGYEQARGIEQHIKRMKSRKYIENLRSYPEMVEQLVKKY